MDRHASNSQAWDINDMLRRAKNASDRHGRLRRDALERLINLAHSDSVAYKILAAKNIRFFFTDFPDLEESAVDAIYDLCEDPSSEVRIEGYLAIIEVSRMESRWIKRNVDVLVQLLQSEEVDEVSVVKKALVEHLEMDLKVTLGVLFDQIVFEDETSDQEEISIRERLRSLVLAFMVVEAKETIRERLAVPGEVGEPIFYEGIFSVIPHLRPDDFNLVLKDLMYALPAFTSHRPSERGSELLQVLLSGKALPSLKEDLQSGLGSLTKSQQILQICEHITCDLQAAPAVDFLQFLCTSLIGKITLQKMQVNDQQWIVCSLSRTLDAAGRQTQSPRYFSLRRTIVDACPYLLEVLKTPTVKRSESVKAYTIFLQACFERAKEPPWTAPSHLLKVLQEFQEWPEVSQTRDHERMFRFLASPSRASVSRTPLAQTKVIKIVSSPRISSPRASGSSLNDAIPNPSSSHDQNAYTMQDRIKRNLTAELPARPSKRTKLEEVVDPPKTPTLLSRLGTSLNRQSSLPELSSSKPPKTSMVPKAKSPPEVSQLSQGFSIKGAAAKQASQNVALSSRVTPSSLLERLQDSWSGDPPAKQQQPGRKRRDV
ncbi:hypothetical protein NP233_g9020 [Leucocoprinus birnbaumii]|uniref:Uncharacterized protein n=1 Tax=Leucocoprinus birnbaumii TaxID=56174 RepID=A0AAD5VNN6_9AGAR|nr:hypothetical protein NP233_g9020 [Leucocoprinus birnbaumii]